MTVLRIARNPWDIHRIFLQVATIERRAQLQKAAVGTNAFIVCTTKLNVYFPAEDNLEQGWQPYHSKFYIYIRECCLFKKRKIIMLLCDDRVVSVQPPHGRIIQNVHWQVHLGVNMRNIHRSISALRLSCGPKNRANFAAEVNMSRHCSATIRLPGGFAILYRGLVAALQS